jgi:transposase-like protein
MRFQDVLALAKLLSKEEQFQLAISLTQIPESVSGAFTSRCEAFINKQEICPCCGGKRYFRYGKMRGSQRFKCKDCDRTFTDYTGTWLDGIHKKSLAGPYMSLMIEHYSLDRIRKKLNINKKTAFDWKHKILSSYEQDTGDEFEGVVESDETFFRSFGKGESPVEKTCPKTWHRP